MTERVIKFRAWDGKKFTDISCAEFYFSRSGELTVGETVEHGTHDEFIHFPLMQFTGLLDANGKEIYEGDIVREQIDREEFILTVAWDAERTCFDLYEYREPTYANDMWNATGNQTEVIGNIYENPELLEQC
jgi:uncharacterized phage protein (TIGR01671 family)